MLGSPKGPAGPGSAAKSMGAEARCDRVGAQGPFGDDAAHADRVVRGAHHVDVAVGVHVQPVGTVDQHAGAAHRDDVVGVEVVPVGGGRSEHRRAVAVPDHGIDGRRADMGRPLPVFESVEPVRTAVRGVGKSGTAQIHWTVVAHPRRHRDVTWLQARVGGQWWRCTSPATSRR